jgi:hypothetical protein
MLAFFFFFFVWQEANSMNKQRKGEMRRIWRMARRGIEDSSDSKKDDDIDIEAIPSNRWSRKFSSEETKYCN